MSTDSEAAAENLAKIVTLDKKHRRAGYRQIKDIHKGEINEKIAMDENLFKSILWQEKLPRRKLR